MCCLQETHFRSRDTYRLKVKGWNKVFYVSGNQKEAGLAIFISYKTDFKIKTVTRDKAGHFTMIKGTIQEEDIIVNIYVPNIGAPQYIRQKLTAIKGEIYNNTLIVGDFNTPLSSIDRSYREKVKKETQALNDTLDQIDLTDIYRAFHPKAAEYTFSLLHMEHSPDLTTCWATKSSLGKFNKIEIISSIYSDHNAMRLEISYKKKTGKKHKHMEAKQYATKQQMDH